MTASVSTKNEFLSALTDIEILTKLVSLSLRRILLIDSLLRARERGRKGRVGGRAAFRYIA